MRTSIRTACIILAALATVSVLTGIAGAQDRFAVIIGINNYLDDSGFGDLETCVNDSVVMYRTLTEHCGYDENKVLLLNDWGGLEEETITPSEFLEFRNRMPMAATLRSRIPAVLARAQEGDTVLVYFSGHGVLAQGEGILATSDCQAGNAANTGLPTKELQGMLLACKAKQKVLLLDCCHAGATAADKSAGSHTSPEELATIFNRAEGLVTLASCGPNEKSHQDKDKGMSYFTFFLTMGLKGKADINRSGIVDHLELHSYVSREVANAMAVDTGNLKQSPKLIANNAKGLFALSRSKKEFWPEDGLVVNTETDSSVPPAPGQEAEEAFERLRVGSSQPLVDVQLLIAEAARLRQPNSKSAVVPPSTRNPFYNEFRANTAFEWLSVAGAASDMSAVRLDSSTDISMKTSQALAAWFKSVRDEKLARQLIDELYPAIESPELQDLQPQLLMVHAQTRDNTPAGHAAALDDYARILKLAKAYEQTTGDSMDPYQLLEDVVTQGLKFSNQFGQQRDPSILKNLAAIHGAFGEIVVRNPVLFPSDRVEAKTNLELAMSLDAQTAEYPLNLAHVLMQMPSPDYTRVRELTRQSQQLSNDGLTSLIGQRLTGQAWLYGSRKLLDVAERKALAENAIQSLSQGVQLYERQFAGNAQLQPRAAEHYVDSLVLRADAFKDQANFLLDFRGNGRRDALDKAIADARKATEIDNERLQHRAWIALGNCLEDSAWLGGKTEHFFDAAEAFRTSIKKDSNNAQARVNLARCMVKWEIDGKQPGHLGEAEAELQYVIDNLFFDETATAKANFWMSKIQIHRGELDAADKSLGLAWDGMKDNSRINRYDFGICVEDRVELNLLRATKLINAGMRTNDDVQNATKFIADANFYARELEKFDLAKAVVLQGNGFASHSLLLKAQSQADQATKKLNDAMANYAKHLNSSALSDRDRCAILLGRCNLIVTTDLRTSDFAKETPQSLSDAIEAAELAGTEADYAAAKGWSGYIRYEFCKPPKFKYQDLDTNPLYTSAIDDLEEAIKTAPNHQSAPRWSFAAGNILMIKVAVLRADPNKEIPISVSRQADEYLQNASADPTLRNAVKTTRERLRQFDPRLNG